jgi:hypothetical protein
VKLLLWMLLVVCVVAGYTVYRQYSDSSRLHVEPHAAKEIEKAKRR